MKFTFVEKSRKIMETYLEWDMTQGKKCKDKDCYEQLDKVFDFPIY